MDDGDSSDIHEVVEGVPPEMVWRGEYVEDVYAAGLVEGGNDDDDDDGIFRILTEHDEEEEDVEEEEPVSGVSDVVYHDDDDDDVPGISADVGGEEDFVARLQASIQRDLPKYVLFFVLLQERRSIYIYIYACVCVINLFYPLRWFHVG
jgi:hypothetical protein